MLSLRPQPLASTAPIPSYKSRPHDVLFCAAQRCRFRPLLPGNRRPALARALLRGRSSEQEVLDEDVDGHGQMVEGG